MFMPYRFEAKAFGIFLLGLALVLLADAALGQVTAPDTPVNQDGPGLNQVETAIAVVPDSQWVFVAYNDSPYPGGPGLGYSYSPDLGVNWFDGHFTQPLGMVIFFDPMAAADRNAGLLYSGGCANDNVVNGSSGVYVYVSADGGVTWAGPNIVSFDGPQTPPSPVTLNDRGHMVVDDDPGSPYVGQVYVTWIKDVGSTGPFSDCWFNSSPGGTAAFVGRQRISDLASGVARVHAPHLATASDGTIYAVWADYDVTTSQAPAILYVDKSIDGGINWGNDVWINSPSMITTVPRLFTDVFGPPTSGDTAPIVAVHPTIPTELYVVYNEDPDGPTIGDEGDIYFIRSTDGAVSWSVPLRINAPPYNVGHQYAPWIDVKPDGRIDVAWYDGQFVDTNPILWSTVMSSSMDGGGTWTPPLMVSDGALPAPSRPGGGTSWLGEYLSIDTDSIWAHTAFASSQNDTLGEIFYDRVNNLLFADCDGNGAPDFVDMANCINTPFCKDCNMNFVLDGCDVDATDPDGNGQVSSDVNSNGIPDECETLGVGYPSGGAIHLVAQPSVMRTQTVLAFGAPLPRRGQIAVFDVGGRVVCRIPVPAGRTDVLWDGRATSGEQVRAGSYFMRLTYDGGTATARVVVTR